MPNVNEQQILELTDVEALTAARSLIVLLDIKLKGTPDSTRPADAEASEPEKLIKHADPATRDLANALEQGAQGEASSSARVLILSCLLMGYEDEVATAYESTKTHVLDMGLLSGPLLVAALAAVIAWVPVETKRKITKKTTEHADGSKTTITEVDEVIIRVGAESVKALKEWLPFGFGA